MSNVTRLIQLKDMDPRGTGFSFQLFHATYCMKVGLCQCEKLLRPGPGGIPVMRRAPRLIEIAPGGVSVPLPADVLEHIEPVKLRMRAGLLIEFEPEAEVVVSRVLPDGGAERVLVTEDD